MRDVKLKRNSCFKRNTQVSEAMALKKRQEIAARKQAAAAKKQAAALRKSKDNAELLPLPVRPPTYLRSNMNIINRSAGVYSTEREANGGSRELLDRPGVQQEPTTEDDSECECTCYGAYCQDEEEWVRCACNRWLHERCMEEVFLDDQGQERFCPFCFNFGSMNFFHSCCEYA